MMNPDESAKDSPAGFTKESSAAGEERALLHYLYENDFSITTRALCARFAITKYQLQKLVEQEGWTPRKKKKPRSVSRAGLIRRMLEALDRRMCQIEHDDLSPEQKVAMLASMSRTLVKVLQMEEDRRRGQAQKSGKVVEELAADMDDLRKKIAKRIEQLNQG